MTYVLLWRCAMLTVCVVQRDPIYINRMYLAIPSHYKGRSDKSSVATKTPQSQPPVLGRGALVADSMGLVRYCSLDGVNLSLMWWMLRGKL